MILFYQQYAVLFISLKIFLVNIKIWTIKEEIVKKVKTKTIVDDITQEAIERSILNQKKSH